MYSYTIALEPSDKMFVVYAATEKEARRICWQQKMTDDERDGCASMDVIEVVPVPDYKNT